MTTPGEVIAHLDKGGTTAVIKLTADGWLVIGQFEYDHAIRDTVFTSEEI